jgi:hypothetical protein
MKTAASDINCTARLCTLITHESCTGYAQSTILGTVSILWFTIDRTPDAVAVLEMKKQSEILQNPVLKIPPPNVGWSMAPLFFRTLIKLASKVLSLITNICEL